MGTSQLTIFPNYAIHVDSDNLWVELSLPLLLDPLQEEGVDITVASCRYLERVKGASTPVSRNLFRFIDIGAARKAGARWLRGLDYVWRLRRIIRTTGTASFSYIFFPGHIGLLVAISCLLLGRPYGLYFRGDFFVGTPRIFHFLLGPILKNAKFVLCTGKTLRQLVEKVNVNTEEVIPMSPMLLLEQYKRPHNQAAQETCTVLFVGQMVREKGIFELFEAVKDLSWKQDISLRLVFVGEGKDKSKLTEQVLESRIRDRILFKGAVQDIDILAEIYRGCDIFCLPSYYPEGVPRVLYEAMLFELPILTTPVGHIQSIIEHGYNGIFCQPKSSESIAGGLRALANDKGLRRRLGMNGQEVFVSWRKQWAGRTHGAQVLRWLQRVDSK